jgi:hypothetical protein
MLVIPVLLLLVDAVYAAEQAHVRERRERQEAGGDEKVDDVDRWVNRSVFMVDHFDFIPLFY